MASKAYHKPKRKRKPPTNEWRRQIIRLFRRDQAATKRKLKKEKTKQRDKTLVAQWRLLKKLGIYQSKDNPSLKNLTNVRKRRINKAFNNLQSLGHYEKGVVYRPAEKTTKHYERISKKGRVTKIERIIYILNNHFTFKQNAPNIKIPNTIKTKKGVLFPHDSDMKIKIVDNKIEYHNITRGKSKIKFTREPITGIEDFLKLAQDIKDGKIKLNKNEGLKIYQWGWPSSPQGFAADNLEELADMIEHYEKIFTTKAFEAWAELSEIVLFKLG